MDQVKKVSSPSGGLPAHLRSLTGLRFIASLAIVFRHFGGHTLANAPDAIQQIAGNGFVTVSLFFVMSGFVLTYNYATAVDAMKISNAKFWIARFARIYPAYLAAFLLAAPFFVRALASHHSWPETLARASLGGAIVLSLTQSWIPVLANYWNSPAWSVSVEAFFYLVFPFFAPWLARMKPINLYRNVGGLWIAAMAAPMLVVIFAHDLGGHSELVNTIQCNPLLRLPEFLIGAIAACIFRKEHTHQMLGSMVSTGAAIAILWVMANGAAVPETFLSNGMLAPLFAILIWGLAQGGPGINWVLASAPMVFLGEISYSFYILQEPVNSLMKCVAGIEATESFCTYVLLLLAISTICHLYLELPASHFIKHTLGRSRWQPTPVESVSPAGLSEA